MEETYRHFRIVAPFGHVGTGKEISLVRFIKTQNMTAAIRYVTDFGGGIKQKGKNKLKGVEIREVTCEQYVHGVCHGMDDYYDFFNKKNLMITPEDILKEEVIWDVPRNY